MPKVPDKYLLVDPWTIVQNGFDAERNRVSESIFSLGNEYMGVRGYHDEGYSGDTLVGSYFNGLYEQMDIGAHYKGIIRSLRYMANAVDWLYTRISIDGEALDAATCRLTDYERKLDLRTGIYSREFIWHTKSGKSVKFRFERLVSMTVSNLGCQHVSIEPLNFTGVVEVCSGLDFTPVHEDQGKNLWNAVRSGQNGNIVAIQAKTLNTGNQVFSGFSLDCEQIGHSELVENEKFIGVHFQLRLEQGQQSKMTKKVINVAARNQDLSADALWSEAMELAAKYADISYEQIADEQANYWRGVWESSDIEIEGDPENQQGIRFCIFQLYQTYRGENPGFNIGAKGLTGEAYRGLAFWDTETYCLPFYMFNNPKAARSLLEFRYRSLPNAMQRAKDVDCEGAFYPIATIDGTESCDLWQHSNLQLHVGTAVAYGIWHYDKIVGDKEFLYTKGIEMLIQISRFYATRGQWGQRSGEYGYFGVMGPDEFQLMVNNNAYTNLLAKHLFEYTVAVIEEMIIHSAERYARIAADLLVTEEEIDKWREMAAKMRIPYDPGTKLYEQHDGFFDMPHIDIHSIPVTDFPLYHNWSYDRLYRYDMIKQPDVLMFMFLYNQQYSLEVKRANYEYYESRCIHESSLSPSIHSILAAELGKHEEAYKFFEFATRLDLDNYNRNTREGLHTTSIAAAWMNIVYGFGGMRSDGEMLSFSPSMPGIWGSYRFRITFQETILNIHVCKDRVEIKAVNDGRVTIKVYGETYVIDSNGVTVPTPVAVGGAG